MPRKENNPAVPITIEEQVESTHEAGAPLGLLHRERHSIATIGWESAMIRCLYARSVVVLFA